MPRTPAIWLLAAVVVALALRLPRLDAELNHDEAFTILDFASRPYSEIVSRYSLPNNHILHTLLVRAAIQLGGGAEWVVRLPALLAGVVAVPVAYGVGRALLGSALPALLAAWIVALHPTHASYSTTARGYSLLVLLSLLALGALWAALGTGRRRHWAALSLAAFLTAWTIPSGALHLAGLAGLAAFHFYRFRQGLVRALVAFGLATVAIGVAYWPLRQDLHEAAAKWAVSLESPLALASLGWQVLMLLGAGSWPPLQIALAAWGLYHLLRQRQGAGAYAAAAFALSFAPALLTGIAGQPRTYLFLLPAIVLAQAHGLAVLSRPVHLRAIVVAVCLGLYASQSVTAAVQPSAPTGYAATGEFLAESRGEARLVVVPFIMGVPLWHYAGERLVTGRREILTQGRIDQLLLVTHRRDPRFALGSYLMSRSARIEPHAIALPPAAFEEVFARHAVAVQRLRGAGVRLFPTDAAQRWRLDPPSALEQVNIGPGVRAFGAHPGMQVRGPKSAKLTFSLFTEQRMRAPGPGLLVLCYAGNAEGAQATLYQEREGLIEPVDMLRTGESAVQTGADGGAWLVEALLWPTEAGQEYGIYIRSRWATQFDIADLALYFFPY